MLVRLFVIRGKANKESVAVSLPAVIGRSRDADLIIIHPMISRRHCQLFKSDGLVKLRDLGSLNGTYLNGEQVQEAFLPPGAVLTVGPLVFRVEYDASPAAICREPSVVGFRSPETPPDEVLIADEAQPESANGSQKTGGIPAHVVAEVSARHAEPATEPSPWQPSEKPAIIHDVPDAPVQQLGGIAPPDGAVPDFSAWPQAAECSSVSARADSSNQLDQDGLGQEPAASQAANFSGDVGQDRRNPQTDSKSWADAPPPFTTVRNSDADLPILLNPEANDPASDGGSSGGNMLRVSGTIPSSRNVPADVEKAQKGRRGWWFFRR